MTATEVLRELLDERGVGYQVINPSMTIVALGHEQTVEWWARERGEGRLYLNAGTSDLTAEQALELMLGRVTTRNGKTRNRYGRDVPLCEHCGQAIGDERWHYCSRCGARIVDEVDG